MMPEEMPPPEKNLKELERERKQLEDLLLEEMKLEN